MFDNIIKYINGKLGKWAIGSLTSALVLTTAVTMTSCDSGLGVYDDLEECPRGVTMRFVFDYNLEFANAFPKQVDCLSVYIFDNNGTLVERRVETTEVLRDEDWRMTFDLPAGDYQAVAYGGLECEESSFAHTKAVESIKTITDLEVLINSEHVGEMSQRPERRLHDLYHGYKQFTVTEGITYDKTTVEMMRDTNHIRVVLQHLDNSPVDHRDFRFEIVDDNTRLDYLNNVVSHQTVSYSPWSAKNSHVGVNGLPDTGESGRASDDYVVNTDPVQVASAEISTSRLIHQSNFTWSDGQNRSQRGPRLLIHLASGDKTIVDIPLNNYLMVLKSDYFDKMDSQEFLDRCANYNLVFFLDKNNAWIKTTIVVNDWTVHIDDINY